ncbi:MAG: VOC family protein [Desulfuromonadales bacterium]
MKIGHVHLKIRNLQRSIDFYQRYLDMQITEKLADSFVFMSAGQMHHELALQEVGEQAVSPQPHGVGLYHVAFEVPDHASLTAAYRKLKQGGVVTYPVDHGISWAVYFNDPDGNGVEVYWDTRRTEHGAEAWGGQNRLLSEAQLS